MKVLVFCLIGLFLPNQRAEFWKNFQHARTGRRVIRAASDYIRIAGMCPFWTDTKASSFINSFASKSLENLFDK